MQQSAVWSIGSASNENISCTKIYSTWDSCLCRVYWRYWWSLLLQIFHHSLQREGWHFNWSPSCQQSNSSCSECWKWLDCWNWCWWKQRWKCQSGIFGYCQLLHFVVVVGILVVNYLKLYIYWWELWPLECYLHVNKNNWVNMNSVQDGVI